MKIVWNKVTWYSKIIALGIVVLLPFAGLLIGLHEGKILGALQEDIRLLNLPVHPATENMYYTDVTAWQTNVRDDAKFSIAYPLDFETTDLFDMQLNTAWRLHAGNTNGVKLFTLTIPKAVEPQTNFQEATLSIGASEEAKAVADCLTPDPAGGNTPPPTTVTINGIPFTVFLSSDAAAGNLYDTVSYRAVRAGQCMAIEYTIHSTQIANYPESYNLHPFNKTRMKEILDRIVGTFQLR